MRRDKSSDSANGQPVPSANKRQRISSSGNNPQNDQNYQNGNISLMLQSAGKIRGGGEPLSVDTHHGKLTTRDLHSIMTATRHDRDESSSSGEFIDLRKYIDKKGDKKYRSVPPKSRTRSRSFSANQTPLPQAPPPVTNGQAVWVPQNSHHQSPISFRRPKNPPAVAQPTEPPSRYYTGATEAYNGGYATTASGYATDYDDRRPGSTQSHYSVGRPRILRSGSFRAISRLFSGKLRPGASSSYSLQQQSAASEANQYPQQFRNKASSRPNSVVLDSWSVNDGLTNAPQAYGNGMSQANSGYQSDLDSHISAPPAVYANSHPRTTRSRPASGVLLTDLGTPALCGIVNHGNTCYINAVVQCLSNTDQMAEYFVTERYAFDLSSSLQKKNKQCSSGDVTIALATLLRAIWFDQYSKKISESFKATIERHSDQYKGNQQQDCQEFFCWLLNTVHEDLNSAIKRKYKPIKQSNSKPESQLAQETLDSHLVRDKSFVTDLFQAQFRSCVLCPDCDVPSLAFDPYMCVQLPIPQRRLRPLFVILVFLNRNPRLLCLGLNAEATASFGEVSDCLCKEAQIPPDQMIVCELTACGFYRTFRRGQPITSLGQSDTVYAFETPPLPLVSVATSSAPMTRSVTQSQEQFQSTQSLILLVLNRTKMGSMDRLSPKITSERYGGPIAVNVDRQLSYAELCEAVLLGLRPQLKSDVYVQEIPLSEFRLRLEDTFVEHIYLPSNVDMPLYIETVDTILSGQSAEFGPPHLKMIVEWKPGAKTRYFDYPEELIVDHVSACDLRRELSRPEIPTLQDCIKLFIQSEQLDWFCNNCRGRPKRAERTITFWSLPDILVFHLKRFEVTSTGEHIKVDSLVQLPVENLDMTPYLYSGGSSIGDGMLSSPKRNPPGPKNGLLGRKSPRTERRMANGTAANGVDLNLYDLFAVCNHRGESVHSGHYTAYCRNPVDLQWYCFDDERVSKLDNSAIVTNAAYLLFYERKSAIHAQSMRNSMESGFAEHWSNRVIVTNGKGSSQDTLDGFETEDEAFVGSSGTSSNNGNGIAATNRQSPKSPSAASKIFSPSTNRRGVPASPATSPPRSGPVPSAPVKQCKLELEPLAPAVLQAAKATAAKAAIAKQERRNSGIIPSDSSTISASTNHASEHKKEKRPSFNLIDLDTHLPLVPPSATQPPPTTAPSSTKPQPPASKVASPPPPISGPPKQALLPPSATKRPPAAVVQQDRPAANIKGTGALVNNILAGWTPKPALRSNPPASASSSERDAQSAGSREPVPPRRRSSRRGSNAEEENAKRAEAAPTRTTTERNRVEEISSSSKTQPIQQEKSTVTPAAKIKTKSRLETAL